jgi:hypothetical protein
MLPAQPGDVRDTWADTAQIEQYLGFTPAVALLQGLRAQWQAVVVAGAS